MKSDIIYNIDFGVFAKIRKNKSENIFWIRFITQSVLID